VLNLDLAQNGLGSHSCGPALQEKYWLRPGEFEFGFRMIPVRSGDNPGQIASGQLQLEPPGVGGGGSGG
jgi:hypothetical protein